MSERTAKTCPHCGGPISILTYTCTFCGNALPRNDGAAHGSSAPIQSKDRPGILGGAIRTMAEALDPRIRLREEARQVPDSPEEIVTFFAKHVGAVSDLHYGQFHFQACEAAITKLKMFSRTDARLKSVVEDLQRELDARPRPKKVLFFIGLGASIAIALASLGFLAQMSSTHSVAVRRDVHSLISEGKYGEARVRAQNLEFKVDREELLKAIDAAEGTQRAGTK